MSPSIRWRLAGLSLVLLMAAIAAGAAGCKGRRGLGHPCGDSGDCEAPLACRRGRCAVGEQAARDMLTQAGAVDDTAERPMLAGPKVKVRWATAENYVFAACQPRERLLGGGCSGGQDGEDSHHLRSWPDGFSDDDTVGARWYCMGSGAVNAYALCQQALEPPAAVDAAVAPTP
ncbi:MAG: hypothetical protein KBG28_18435 [Kofleriaceae bacterium]|nr:hypothetical protein [Kofleriaceae bacterium]